MDSCHIFNFIFGAKKATTELSRCFSNISENVTTSARSSQQQQQQPPKSPLKQLQNKFANLVSKVQKTTDDKDAHLRDAFLQDEITVSQQQQEQPTASACKATTALDSRAELVCAQSGTYKATLVRSLSDESDEQPETRCIVNPIHDNDDDDDYGDDYDEMLETSIQIIENPLQLAHEYEEPKTNETIGRNDESRNEKISNNDNDNSDKEHQETFRAEQIVSSSTLEEKEKEEEEILPQRNDKRSLYVRNLVRSIESGSVDLEQIRRSFDEACEMMNGGDKAETRRGSQHDEHKKHLVSNINNSPTSKPTTLVKPLPPKAPPKSFRAKCIRHQLSLSKPTKLQQLFQDDNFLAKFFEALEPLERCAAAQVCRKWRDILYSDHKYWKGLINVIDCTQLRREHLVECIVNTLQSAKMKQQYNKSSDITTASENVFGFDNEDVWKIQEICNKFAFQKHNHSIFKPQSDTCNGPSNSEQQQQQQQHHQQQICSTSKSSSIPSQISSTFSSASLSSILSPLSESSRIETLKEKLYTSIDSRGFEAISLFGATDDDIEDLVCKIPSSSHERITVGRLNNCSITNRGLDMFITSFHLIRELELTGCNELTNAFDLSPLTELKRLTITDCINIADGLAQKLMLILDRLTDFTIQAYHLTDAFIEFLSMNCDTSKLQRLELVNCKEITNQSVIVLAKHFAQLEYLSISGSIKVSDDGIEILAEQATKLKSLDLSWCPRVTDGSLECIACELSESLTDLVLDRNVNITDIGLGYLTAMNKLSSLQIRWCARITDAGIESLLALRSLKHLSLAGIHQITARSLLGLVDMNLEELELTNCPAVNDDLVMFLSTKLPNCNIIF